MADCSVPNNRFHGGAGWGEMRGVAGWQGEGWSEITKGLVFNAREFISSMLMLTIPVLSKRFKGMALLDLRS